MKTDSPEPEPRKLGSSRPLVSPETKEHIDEAVGKSVVVRQFVTFLVEVGAGPEMLSGIHLGLELASSHAVKAALLKVELDSFTDTAGVLADQVSEVLDIIFAIAAEEKAENSEEETPDGA